LYFEGSPPAEDPQGVKWWGRSRYILCSHVPMFPWKDFLMGRIKKMQKHKEERDRSGKFKKTRKKEWMKEKEEISMYVEVPILVCSPSVGNTLGLLPSSNPPSGEPTCIGTFPTTKCSNSLSFAVYILPKREIKN
jgi:hypothetical protein